MTPEERKSLRESVVSSVRSNMIMGDCFNLVDPQDRVGNIRDSIIAKSSANEAVVEPVCMSSDVSTEVGSEGIVGVAEVNNESGYVHDFVSEPINVIAGVTSVDVADIRSEDVVGVTEVNESRYTHDLVSEPIDAVAGVTPVNAFGISGIEAGMSNNVPKIETSMSNIVVEPSVGTSGPVAGMLSASEAAFAVEHGSALAAFNFEFTSTPELTSGNTLGPASEHTSGSEETFATVELESSPQLGFAVESEPTSEPQSTSKIAPVSESRSAFELTFAPGCRPVFEFASENSLRSSNTFVPDIAAELASGNPSKITLGSTSEIGAGTSAKASTRIVPKPVIKRALGFKRRVLSGKTSKTTKSIMRPPFRGKKSHEKAGSVQGSTLYDMISNLNPTQRKTEKKDNVLGLQKEREDEKSLGGDSHRIHEPQRPSGRQRPSIFYGEHAPSTALTSDEVGDLLVQTANTTSHQQTPEPPSSSTSRSNSQVLPPRTSSRTKEAMDKHLKLAASLATEKPEAGDDAPMPSTRDRVRFDNRIEDINRVLAKLTATKKSLATKPANMPVTVYEHCLAKNGMSLASEQENLQSCTELRDMFARNEQRERKEAKELAERKEAEGKMKGKDIEHGTTESEDGGKPVANELDNRIQALVEKMWTLANETPENQSGPSS